MKVLSNRGRIDYAKEIKGHHRQSRHQGDTNSRWWGSIRNFYTLETGSAKCEEGNHHSPGCARGVSG
ncbi:hypothetical protein CCP4SC76_7600015 [Gammaproteobacteria bacterium]